MPIHTPPPVLPPQASALHSCQARRYRSRWRRLLPLLIPMTALLGVVVAAALNLHSHSGAFWRDELSSIALAKLPNPADMYAHLEQDSAPLLFAFLVKCWMALGLGAGHASLALLGLALYGALAGALFWSVRTMGVRLPLLGSVFLLVNVTVFYWGTSMRSYGLAALLSAALVGCVWRFISEGSWKRWIASSLVAVLCAQANYQDSYVIFSVCTAGAMVCAVRRQWGRSAATLLIGGGAALSLLPYYPVIAGASVWKILLAPPLNPLEHWVDVLFILGSGNKWLGALWLTVPLYLVAAACGRGWRALRRARLGGRGSRILFAGLTLLLLAISLPAFVWAGGRDMMPWYYLPSFTVMACFLDLPVQRFCRAPLAAWGLGGAVALLLLLQTPGLISYSKIRRTNLDLLVTRIGEQAVPGDFIMVSPLWIGQAFTYYYRGSAPWALLPGLSSPDAEALDGSRILQLARSPQAALLPLMREMERTLRSGHRVWVVGDLRAPQDGQAPVPPSSLKIADCTSYWDRAAGLFLQQHVTSGTTPFDATPTGPVMYLECLPVRQYSGWRE